MKENKSKKRKFEHSKEEFSLAVHHYLTHLAQGIKSKKLTMSGDDQEVNFNIPETMQFSIDAEKGKDNSKIVLTLKWKDESKSSSKKSKDESKSSSKKSKKEKTSASKKEKSIKKSKKK